MLMATKASFLIIAVINYGNNNVEDVYWLEIEDSKIQTENM